MTLKYNRIALIPHTCSICNRIFWLEPYRCNLDDHLIATFVEPICKECVDNYVDKTEITINND